MPTTLNNEGVKFPDNSTQTSAKTLLAEVPVASGESVTAGRVVSIDAAGAVGAYPVPNAVTGEVASNVFENYDPVNFDKDYSRISKNGTRAMGIRNMANGASNTTSGRIDQWTGFVITQNSITAGSPTANISVNRGSNGWFSDVQLQYVHNSEERAINMMFHVNYSLQSRTQYREFNVASNGSLTFSPDAAHNVDGSYWTFYYGVRRLTNNIFIGGNRGGASFSFRYITLNGTGSAPTMNTTINADIARPMFELGGESRLTPNSIFIAASGNTIRRCTYTNATSVLTNYLQYSNFIPNVGSSEPSLQTFLTEDGLRYIAIYRNTLSEMEIRIFNISSTTGEPTFADSTIIKSDASVFKYDNVNISFKNNEQFLMTFLDAGIYYAQSVDLNTNGTIKGLNQRQSIDPNRIEPKYNPASDKHWLNFKTNNPNTHRIKHYIVNAYSTIPFNKFGIATETKSSGNVKVIINGIASGFSGLVVGKQYYLNDTTFDGTVSENANNFLIGVAISTTEIKLV